MALSKLASYAKIQVQVETKGQNRRRPNYVDNIKTNLDPIETLKITFKILHKSTKCSYDSLKGLCHPTPMREPKKTNLKKLACLFQVLSEILEGCFCLSKSQPSFDS